MKSWLFMGALFVLCGVLGVLQYQWIGELAELSGDRLRSALDMNLARLSQDFHAEIASALREVAPIGAENAEEARSVIEARFAQARKPGNVTRMFRRIGLVIPRNGTPALELLNISTGKMAASEWPEEWELLRERMAARAAPGFPPMEGGGRGDRGDMDGLLLVESPVFAPGPEGWTGRGPGRPYGRKEVAWTVFELDPDYLRDSLLPEIVERHSGWTAEYDLQLVSRSDPSAVLWASRGQSAGIAPSADAAVGLLDPRMSPFGEGGRGRGGRGMRPGRGGGPGPGMGRWTLYVRHRAGSLKAVAAQTRSRNLAVTGGVLLLLVATIMALFRFTRNAQNLARMQMDFVAGVSHELRTPLTAIYTAGHNLRGRLAQNPAQVERYGEMIQQETGRLRELVEQVLRFASANAGRVIQARSAVETRKLIEETLEASRSTIQATHCTVEQTIEDGLPEILADPLALKHALHNLVANAVKYGAKEDPWIGIAASKAVGARGPAVEIRVADRGPGIPEEEQRHIFDAFYRGHRAVQDQIHGAGLGLNLAKKIVEAHGGSIRVKSAPGQGAEFIVQIPAAPEVEAA